MNRGILFAALAALAISTSVTSCRRAADPYQLAVVDSLTNALEAVRLTLNELDTQRYATADSIFRSNYPLFLQRFKDTLDKPTATALGDQFVQLRETAHRAADHRMMLGAVNHTSTRLKELEQDLIHAALPEEEVSQALLDERHIVEGIENGVLQLIANYQANQRVLEQQAHVDSLLAVTLPEHRIK